MTSSNRLGFFCMLVALAVGFWGFAERATAVVIYEEDFLGSVSDNLNGSTVDIDNTGASTTTTWLAYSGFKQNGLLATANVSQGAWLPFAPQANNTYSLSASLTGVGPDGSSVAWYAIGFAKALPTVAQAESGQNRFNETPTLGRAWMNFRPNNPTSPDNPNVTHRFGNANGTDTPVAWTDPTLARAEGGDIDMQIVLDTNPAIWTATFFAKRPTDSLYTAVSNGALNLTTQDILGVGFARTTGTLSGMITKFTLESVAPILVSGDVDGNHVVDDVDFGIIRDHLFQSGTRSQGDLTNDGLVDFSDFRQWKTAHEAGSGAGASLNGAVPEPASALLAMLAVSIGFVAGLRRRHNTPQRNL